MGDFNKVISFVLGLIVVVVALVVITRKYDFTKKLLPLSSNAKVSVTPTPTGRLISEVIVKGESGENSQVNNYQKNNYQQPTNTSGRTPSSIPATGGPTFLLPIYAASFFLGLRLRKNK